MVVPAGSVAPLDVEDVRARVDQVLAETMTRHRHALTEVDPASVELLDAIAGLLDGGKRLRPGFCYWGWRGAGGALVHAPVIAAAALEMFQAAALVHDDVIDDSDTRRGKPTVHRYFANLHTAGTGGESWRGDEERFGVASAILAGDLCLAWSSELMVQASTADVRPENWRAARAVYDTMCTQLMAGQYLDVHEQAEALGTVDRALHVIRYKSAKYTIEHPLLIGGLLAGAEPAVLQTYSNYALPLGEAFQLRDDMLGVFGDPELTGKPSGDDLREGKRTVLIALAAQTATPAQREVLERALGDADLSDDTVHAVRDILTETGAAQQVESMITRRVDEAEGALRNGIVEDEARQILAALVVAATKRRY